MKTIKQIADEIGVSKQAVQKRLSREPLKSRLYPYIDTKQGTKYIADIGQKMIIEAFSAEPTTASIPASTPPSIDASIDMSIDKNSNVHTLIAMLQEQLTTKDRQIEAQGRQLESRDKQIGELTAALENTTASLQAAQALHAGTMHKQLAAPAQDEAAAVEVAPEKPETQIESQNSTAKPEPRWGLSWWPFGRK